MHEYVYMYMYIVHGTMLLLTLVAFSWEVHALSAVVGVADERVASIWPARAESSVMLLLVLLPGRFTI